MEATHWDFFSLKTMRYILAIVLLISIVGCGSNESEEKKTSPLQPVETKNVAQPHTKLDSINKLIANDNRNAKLLAIRANIYLSAYNMDAARADIHMANTIDTNVALLRQARGEMAYMLSKGPVAKKEWEECIKLDPQNLECLSRLTELYIAIQNYDRALVLVNKILDINSSDAQAYFMKGIIVRDKYRDTTLALQYFQNAVDIKQDYIDALDMLGVLLAARGDTLAKYYYLRILEQQPRRDDIYYKLGVYYMDRGETNRALEAYDKCVQINPKNANAYYSMGYMFINFNDYNKAKEYFSKSILWGENNYRAHYARGYCFEMQGDLINAKKDYTKSIEMLNMYRPAQEALARINRIEAEQ